MFKPHQGKVFLHHDFATVWDHLSNHGGTDLYTDVGTLFSARASKARDGRLVIRFFQHGIEYARCYQCCWGHYYNCNRTRIGMYIKALDRWLDESK